MNKGKDRVNLSTVVVRDSDPINPQHYKKHQSGIECIDIIEWMNLNLGTAIKYIWRCSERGSVLKHIEDLRKARWYIDREIQRLERS